MSTPLGPWLTARSGPTLREPSGMSERRSRFAPESGASVLHDRCSLGDDFTESHVPGRLQDGVGSGREIVGVQVESRHVVTGWGAVPALFDENNSEFAEDRQAVREYLGPELYAAASRSTINAHYTDPELVDAMWGALRTAGFDGGSVLEPGCGSGNFLGAVPEDLLEATRLTGVELDPVAANVARALYPTPASAPSPTPTPRSCRKLSTPRSATSLSVRFGCTTSATIPSRCCRSMTTSWSRPST